MVAKYDIFKKIEDSFVWVEAVEDIVAAKKRLISLASEGTDGYRIWVPLSNSSSTRWTIAPSYVNSMKKKNANDRVRSLMKNLIREGHAARFLCAPNQNFGKPPPCSWSGYDYYERSKP